MRTPIIAGNWKLHKTISEGRELVKKLKEDLADISDREIIIAPVFTSLAPLAVELAGSNIQLAAQNCHPAESGAFTGEVSTLFLKDAGCTSVIVGHSERRQLFGETDAFINAKIKAVLAAGMQAIFCIGETLAERESGEMFDVLTRQVREGLSGLDSTAMSNVIIAYEPVWAIGTGKVASVDEAQDAHVFIRGLISGLFVGKIEEQMRILYGGSVKPENIDGLMAQEDIDGVLVGGASLKADDFIRIVRFTRL
ncbi:MAG: triose-phosphate isomerase [Deltaproteobacteria bacterium HGW-Deltaproteobacteria-4]|nr:MAG: triose-phosphate isomerase [Deltaproteobacteria bacterium HGW-Deltaproteobacteria-4]